MRLHKRIFLIFLLLMLILTVKSFALSEGDIITFDGITTQMPEIYTSDEVNKNLEYELYANNKLIQKEQDITTDLYNDVYCPDFNSPTGYIVNVSLICLGREYDEVISEDNTYPLFLMNMNLKRFKSPISTVFVYGFIDD